MKLTEQKKNKMREREREGGGGNTEEGTPNLEGGFGIRLFRVWLHRLGEALHKFLHILALVLVLEPEGLVLHHLLFLG